jgi:hypothetical protein
LAHWIWLRRNTLVFEGTFIHPNIVFKGAVDALDEFKKCHMQIQMFLYQRLTVVFLTVKLNWQPLPIGFIKVNWDAAITTKDV